MACSLSLETLLTQRCSFVEVLVVPSYAKLRRWNHGDFREKRHVTETQIFATNHNSGAEFLKLLRRQLGKEIKIYIEFAHRKFRTGTTVTRK